MQILDISAIPSDKLAITALLGSSGTGKTTFMNEMAGEQLGQTGKHLSQTRECKEYRFTRNGQHQVYIDMPGFHDNQGLSDEQIMKMASSRIAMYPESAKIRFVLVENIDANRITLPECAAKYKTIFGPQYLASSIVVTTHCDKAS